MVLHTRVLSHAGLSVRQCISAHFVIKEFCICSFFFSSQCLRSLCSSFLLLFILFAIWLVSCLGGQGSHGIADGFIVWVNTRQVLQDTLKELWVLHHIIVIFLLFNYNRGYNQSGCIRSFSIVIFISVCVCVMCIVSACLSGM